MQSKAEDISADIYAGFVRSLFNDPSTLLMGACCHALMGSLVYRLTGHWIYLALTALMFLAGAIRASVIVYFHRKGSITDGASARRWEAIYLACGTFQGFCLGLFCFATIYLVPDDFGELASIATAMGSTITIVGRNYGSRKMVNILALTIVLPIATGLMLNGDLYHILLGLLIVPFMVITIKMATHVRTVLFTAIMEGKSSKQIAQRFDRALNTMSHGLAMMNAQGQIVVANAEAAHMLGMRSPSKMIGRTLHSLLMRGVAAGLMEAKDCHYVESQLGRALRDQRDRKLLVSFSDGRHIEFSAREGSNDLGVITFEDVTARIDAEERIRFMARYDSLTGLPNRAYFHELVAEHMTIGDRSRLCGLVVVDLDDFKSVNDTLGHPIGDGLIYAVASKLSSFASDTIKVSRFGGDEFVLFFDQVKDQDEFVLLLSEVFERVSGDVDVAGHLLRLQVSAGAVLSAVQRTDVDSMFVKADLALYKAKEQGKNGWRIFETAMDDAFRNRQIMKADLRSAVENGKLRVVYQPIVGLNSMRIDGCEALCRWDHPELGPISPSVFIALAEEIGIISDVSIFVLNMACRECLTWPEQIGVSVNLSAKDFRDGNIVEHVRLALEQSGLEPGRLEIEVTETALLADKSQSRHYLEDLKALGVRIALDDFGTGYSSLSYLHTLPLDKIKIDRSFIMDLARNERSLTLLKGIVGLSRSLGLQVTVEGVETFEQLRILSDTVEPDLLQGFLFGAALNGSGINTIAATMWPFGKELRKTRQISAI
ncbi:putative bifunctional diguanylate cyclase/phosphodiesterase [Tianweitania sp.]|uniref:putative bifunctional diguanylate cyclase/phosphodiesterase n=1 Tax=Tianweitania sp. TaxID=2021634 RepID=UPI00289E9088|nr:EAL domain-containing protein [Tianweitania sp.]